MPSHALVEPAEPTLRLVVDDGTVLEGDDRAELDHPEEQPAPEDVAEVGRCLVGDPDAYAALYRRWFPRCRAAAARVLGPGAGSDADDIAQEAMTIAWTRLDQLRDGAAFGPWVARIARNLALDHVKRRRVPVDPLHGLEEDHRALVHDREDPQLVVAGRERDLLVRQAAAGLGPRDGEVFEHVVDGGLTPAQVAEALGVSDNHAYQILFRFRGRVQSGLRAALVWRQGRPRCADLAALVPAGSGEFTAEVAATVSRHLRRCEECARDADRHATGTHLLSGFAAALMGKLPSWLTRTPASEGLAVGAGAGADVAVRVVAGIGVATTLTGGGLLVVGSLPDDGPAPASPPRAAAPSRPGGALAWGGPGGGGTADGRPQDAAVGGAADPCAVVTSGAPAVVVVAARRPVVTVTATDAHGHKSKAPKPAKPAKPTKPARTGPPPKRTVGHGSEHDDRNGKPDDKGRREDATSSAAPSARAPRSAADCDSRPPRRTKRAVVTATSTAGATAVPTASAGTTIPTTTAAGPGRGRGAKAPPSRGSRDEATPSPTTTTTQPSITLAPEGKVRGKAKKSPSAPTMSPHVITAGPSKKPRGGSGQG